MTTPSTARTKIVLRGDIAAVQSWSVSLSLAPAPATVSQSSLTAVCTAAMNRFATWWSASTGGLAGRNAADVRFLGADAYLYAAGGGGGAALQASTDLTTPVAGTSTGPHPTQTSLVVTLLTGLPGRSFRGRMYLPMTGGALGTNHQLTQANVTDLVTAGKAFFDGLNTDAASLAYGSVCVHGRAGDIEVESIRIDSEPDVQRRRANKLQPAFFGNANLA